MGNSYRYRGNIVFDNDSNYYYICDQGQGFQLYKYDRQHNFEKQLTFDSRYSILDLYVNSSDTILLLASEHGQNLDSLWILPNGADYPTKIAPNRDENCLQGITDKSGKIIIYNSINEKGITNINIFNLETLKERTLFLHEGYCVIGELSPSGKYLPVLVSLQGIECKLILVDLELNVVVENDWSSPGLSIELIAWESEETLTFLNESWDDYKTLYKWDINKASPEKCFNSDWDIEEVVFIDSDNIIYKTNESGVSVLYLRNLSLKQNKNKFNQDSYIGKMNINRMNNTLVLRLSTISKEESIYIFSLEDFKIHPPLKDYKEPIFVEKVMIKRNDNSNIPALLYRSKDKSVDKIFIYLHGGPHSQHTFTFHPVINELVSGSSNISVLAPNIIGSSGYGKSYMQPVNGNWGKLDVRDIEYIVRWINEQLEWKDKQVYIGGESYGGFLALLSIGKIKYKWSGGISVNGPTDLIDFKRKLPHNMQNCIVQTDDNSELLSRSPYSYVKNINCPLLILQSELDSKVSRASTEKYILELLKEKKDYKLLYLQDNHDIELSDSLETIISEISQFLQ